MHFTVFDLSKPPKHQSVQNPDIEVGSRWWTCDNFESGAREFIVFAAYNGFGVAVEIPKDEPFSFALVGSMRSVASELQVCWIDRKFFKTEEDAIKHNAEKEIASSEARAKSGREYLSNLQKGA